MDHSRMYITEEDTDKYPTQEERFEQILKKIVPVNLGMDWQVYMRHIAQLGIVTIEVESLSHMGLAMSRYGYHLAPRKHMQEPLFNEETGEQEEEGAAVMILVEKKQEGYYSLVPATIWRVGVEDDPRLVQVLFFSQAIRAKHRKHDFLETVHMDYIYLPYDAL